MIHKVLKDIEVSEDEWYDIASSLWAEWRTRCRIGVETREEKLVQQHRLLER